MWWKLTSPSSVAAPPAGKAASTSKAPVMIAVENVGTEVNRKLRLGRVRLGVVDAPGSKQLESNFARTPTVDDLVSADSHRRRRGCSASLAFPEGYKHRVPSPASIGASREPGHVTLARASTGSALATETAGTARHASLPRGTRTELQYYLERVATIRFNAGAVLAHRARNAVLPHCLQRSGQRPISVTARLHGQRHPARRPPRPNADQRHATLERAHLTEAMSLSASSDESTASPLKQISSMYVRVAGTSRRRGSRCAAG